MTDVRARPTELLAPILWVLDPAEPLAFVQVFQRCAALGAALEEASAEVLEGLLAAGPGV